MTARSAIRRLGIGLTTLLLATAGVQAQSIGDNPDDDGLWGPFTVTAGWWYSQIEDRGPANVPAADSTGPAINLRYDFTARFSAGLTATYLFGDITGSIVDPYVEWWITPIQSKQPFYVGVYLGHHWGDYEYAGSDPRFVFADGSVGDYRDSGAFAGVEGWLPLDERWTLKGTLSWYPAESDANFFDTDEMHPLYALGVGYTLDSDWSLSLVGALSPLADDALLVFGVSADF